MQTNENGEAIVRGIDIMTDSNNGEGSVSYKEEVSAVNCDNKEDDETSDDDEANDEESDEDYDIDSITDDEANDEESDEDYNIDSITDNDEDGDVNVVDFALPIEKLNVTWTKNCKIFAKSLETALKRASSEIQRAHIIAAIVYTLFRNKIVLLRHSTEASVNDEAVKVRYTYQALNYKRINFFIGPDG
ncbi:hypothetical protein HK096_000856, partial [Nowakowskiella sp. JEL0078]